MTILRPENLEARLSRVLTVAAQQLRVPEAPPLHTGDIVLSGRGRWWKRRPWFAALSLVISAAIVGGGATAAAGFFRQAPVTNYGTARCYTEATLKGGKNFAGTTVVAAGVPRSPASVANAFESCKSLWEQGFLQQGVPNILRTTVPAAKRVVPMLVVCTMPNGTAAVFPGGPGTCAHLGLILAEGRGQKERKVAVV